MLRRIGLALAVALISAQAWAGAVSGLSAVTSVVGTDIFYDVQSPGAGGLKATASQIATYALGATTGDCSYSAFVSTCLTLNGVSPGLFFNGTNAANLSGTLNAARLPTSGATPGTYADSTHVPQITVDSTGRITSVTNVAVTGGGGSGCVTSGSSILYGDGAGGCLNVTLSGAYSFSGGVLSPSATVATCTTSSFSAPQWEAGRTCVVKTAGQTLMLLASSGYVTNGGVIIQTGGQSVTLAPTGLDTINGANASVTIAANLTSYVTTDGLGAFIATPTTAGGGSGTVTSASVVSANGFAGSVATATTTPAITLSTTVTGVLKGNGTAVSAAAAGTDYQAPISLTTTGTSGAATFTSNTLNIPQYTGGGGSGAVTLVSTCTFNNTTSNCAWTGLTGSEYDLRCYGLISGNSAHNLGIIYGTGAGPTWDTGATSYQRNLLYAIGSSPGAINATAEGIGLFASATSGTNASSFTAHLHNLNNSAGAVHKNAETLATSYNGSAWITSNSNDSFINSTAAVTGVRMADTNATPANLASGQCSLYAIGN